MSDECTAYPSDLFAAFSAAMLEIQSLKDKYSELVSAAREVVDANGDYGYEGYIMDDLILALRAVE